ncbi:hypothetical protein [Frondihabitans peucedani]|uniref:Uncharacterized protein n=1 Tax=Frondihabitans peucedani TaxID=598626 RepID=A0ABP8E4V8_9MICO
MTSRAPQDSRPPHPRVISRPRAGTPIPQLFAPFVLSLDSDDYTGAALEAETRA